MDVVQMWAAVRQDLERHGGRWRHPGFQALMMYRFGSWRASLRHSWMRKALRPVYVLWHRRVRNRHHIELHYTSDISRGVKLSGRGGIVVGNIVTIGPDCELAGGVTIGKASERSTGWPKLGASVRVGSDVVIAGDVSIGDGAVIGSRAVVVADVPPGATVLALPEAAPALRPRRSHGPTG